MAAKEHVHLSRRERQIMDVLYESEEASAGDIHQKLPDSPSYSSVRALLMRLVGKGHIVFRQEGPRYLYRPVLPKDDAKKGAIGRLLETFFSGSAKDAVVNLLGSRALSAEDLDDIEEALEKARAKGKRGG